MSAAEEPTYAKPELPFAEDALAKAGISQETIQYHYGKHHLGYWRKLNALAKTDADVAKRSVEEHVLRSEGKAYNLAAQIWNHSFYWASMSASPKAFSADSELGKAIAKSFGSFDDFRKQFSATAAGHFGSGWVWLVLDRTDGSLKITEGHDAVNPLRDGLTPVLTIDVWEHAYYIDQRNNRGTYIDVWWNCQDWAKLEERFTALASML